MRPTRGRDADVPGSERRRQPRYRQARRIPPTQRRSAASIRRHHTARSVADQRAPSSNQGAPSEGSPAPRLIEGAPSEGSPAPRLIEGAPSEGSPAPSLIQP